MKNQFVIKGMVLIIGIGVAGAGCTKKRPYDEILKDQVLQKSSINTNEEYVYVPSIENSYRNNSTSRPYWLGDAKIVKFRFTEKSLDVLEQEPDARFAENSANAKPVLSIPVSHLDYHCAENSVGECSNKEEENSKITWNQKSKFKPDMGAMAVREINSLPLQLQNLFVMGSCFVEKGNNVLDYKFTPDTINIRVERTFTADLECVGSIESLSDLTFNVIHHYSFARYSTIATPGYQPVSYPQADQSTFGFFTTDSHKLSNDNRDRVEGQQTFLNRWNPTSEVVYYLSDNFNKPEYASVKKSSYDAIAAINDGLAKAGAKLHVTLKEPAGKVPGDLRANMIVMVEDPVGGLLGYGPSVADPRTGELLNAKVMMYTGTLKQTMRNNWDEIIALRKQKAAASEAAKNAGAPAKPGEGPKTLTSVSMAALAPLIEASNSGKYFNMSSFDSSDAVEAKSIQEAQSYIKKIDFMSKSGSSTAGSPGSSGSRGSSGQASKTLSPAKLLEMEKYARDYTRFSSATSDVKSRVAVLSQYNITPMDLANVNDAVNNAIEDNFSNEDLKPWEELSEEKHAHIMTVMLPYVFTPVLIHELGHNMGLRHNFSGSEDKDNWYSDAELTQAGLKLHMPYSSVMEYSYRDLNQLRLMGKYDIAAFRFGYTRQVQLKDGSFADLPVSLDAFNAKFKKPATPPELRSYKYCTDEHVDVNAGCKRFDEGTTLTEIAQHWVRSYDEYYRQRNFRNHAKNFSTMNDNSYADRIDGVMFNLRMMLEARDRIQARFSPTDDQWNSISFLADLDGAAQIAGKFMLKVITTPDVSCVLLDSRKEKKVTKFVPLANIDPSALACSQVQFIKGIKLLGEGGKSFKSRKDPNSDNPYGDQIDVRGIWIDKLLAAKYLFQRQLGISSLDETPGSFVDYKDFANQIGTTFQSIIDKQIVSDIDYITVDGDKATINTGYDLDLDVSQKIMSESASRLNRGGLVSLPDSDTFLLKELVGLATRETPYLFDNTNVAPFIDAFRVFKFPAAVVLQQNGGEAVTVNDMGYLALPEHQIGTGVIDNIIAVRTMSKVSPDDLKAILDEKTKPVTPPATPPITPPVTPLVAPNAVAEAVPAPDPRIAAVKKLSTAQIQRFVEGKYESEDYYNLVLTEVLGDASVSLSDIAKAKGKRSRSR